MKIHFDVYTTNPITASKGWQTAIQCGATDCNLYTNDNYDGVRYNLNGYIDHSTDELFDFLEGHNFTTD